MSVACVVAVIHARVAIVGVLFVVVLMLAATWITFVGLERHTGNETPEGFGSGVFAMGPFITAPWPDIECFEALGSKSIYLKLRSGRRYWLLGINQQYVTRWREGTTRGSSGDIVAELNERLALWQRWTEKSQRD